MSHMIEFSCPVCREELEINPRSAGKEKQCPECNTPIRVPRVSPARNRPSERSRRDKKSVKVRMGIANLGGLETTVSKQDAGRMGHTFVGGIIALLGVIVCAMLGLRMHKK
jgi:hypothetical protein